MERLLNYKGQGLTDIPETLLQHKHITNLNLEDNNISVIPDWIEELTDLKVLYLNNNRIGDITPLTKLANLEVLQLNNNQISFIPDNVANWCNLKRLFINGNLLTNLPALLGQLKQLTFLLAAENHLKHIDDNLFFLPKLETLNLFNNRLTSLSDNICQLIKLNYLQLSMNQIEQLPESIGENSNLTTLSAFSNKLNTIPSQLEKLPILRSLNIADNQLANIDHVPNSVERLSIYANPVKHINPAILDNFIKNKNGGYTYLFVDSDQKEKLQLEKRSFGKQLQTVDISSGKIYRAYYKDMPQELVDKWGLSRSISADVVR